MIFTPFSFIKTEAAAPSAWTPADITNVVYWWNTGYGLNLSGTEVLDWDDQLTGRRLSKYAGTGMTYTAANASFNNQPTVYQSGLLSPVTATFVPAFSSNDISVIVVCAPQLLASSNYHILGGAVSQAGLYAELVNWQASPSDADRMGFYFFKDGSSNGRVSSGYAFTNEELLFHAASYNASTGNIAQYVNSSTAANTTTFASNADFTTTMQVEIGGYDNVFKPKAYIMEYIFVNGVISSADLTELNTYVQNKYS